MRRGVPQAGGPAPQRLRADPGGLPPVVATGTTAGVKAAGLCTGCCDTRARAGTWAGIPRPRRLVNAAPTVSAYSPQQQHTHTRSTEGTEHVETDGGPEIRRPTPGARGRDPTVGRAPREASAPANAQGSNDQLPALRGRAHRPRHRCLILEKKVRGLARLDVVSLWTLVPPRVTRWGSVFTM